MSAKKNREDAESNQQGQGNGQNNGGQNTGQDPKGQGAGGGPDSEQARSQANAKAAAEEAARLAEEAARQAGEQGAGASQAGSSAESHADQLQAEIDDLKQRLQRAMAETENVRRRADRERQEAMKYAAAPLAKDLLGVADNLRRALESVPQDRADNDETVKNLLSGVQMTEKELADAFAKHGIQKLQPQQGDRFDPHKHEAMYEVPTDDYKPGSVMHVVQDGYVLNDRLLRPARVGVAKAASGGQQGGPGGNVDTQA